MTLHHLLDWEYGARGAEQLEELVGQGANPLASHQGEQPIHVAARRRRPDAVQVLLRLGADLEGTTTGGQTAWVHAARRGFDDVCSVLEAAGASTHLTDANLLAVLLSAKRFEEAQELLESHPGLARTGNPEEDRLLADVAGRNAPEPVELLLGYGADVAAPGLDGGTPLHQACWFGQPGNAEILVRAGAPIDAFDPVHRTSPIGWVVHGSRFSGGAAERADVYVALAELLVRAGCSFEYPWGPEGAYARHMLGEAAPGVRKVIAEAVSP